MKQAFQIPENVLTSLEEVSGGSFLLFILDEEGNPVVYENHDSMGLEAVSKHFAQDWLEADREIRKENMMEEMYEAFMAARVQQSAEDDDGEGEEWK